MNDRETRFQPGSGPEFPWPKNKLNGYPAQKLRPTGVLGGNFKENISKIT